MIYCWNSSKTGGHRPPLQWGPVPDKDFLCKAARGVLMFTVVKRSSLPVCLLAIFLGAAISGAGQSSAPAPGVVAPPVLTFVLDSSGGLRPLIGIPGSASVGSAVH